MVFPCSVAALWLPASSCHTRPFVSKGSQCLCYLCSLSCHYYCCSGKRYFQLITYKLPCFFFFKYCNILISCNLHITNIHAFKYTVLRMLRNAHLCVATALNIEYVIITPNDRKSLLISINLCCLQGNYGSPFCLLYIWSQTNRHFSFGF